MLTDQQMTRLSKVLSTHLRHRPDAIGLILGPGGWVAVETLLAALAQSGKPMSRSELEEVVARNQKRRFEIDDVTQQIRASQGHSVAVDLGLTPVEPPAVLYHGTHEPVVATILRDGLHKMRRHHVHLSADEATAQTVGARRGRPVVLQVDAAGLHAAGGVFLCSANGVWLIDAVPPAFLRRQPTEG